jgi:hypothetical protein
VLVLPARADDERDAVAAAWAGRGWPVRRLDRFWDPPADLPREAARPYGDMTFCLVVAEKLGLELLSPPDDLLLRAGPEWTHRRIEGMTLDQAIRRAAGPYFAKPLAPKLFAAGVFADGAELARHAEGFEPDTPVLVSEPVDFINEARCLLLDGETVSAAFYEGAGDSAEAARFAAAFARKNAALLPRTLVLDVGEIAGRGWAIVEANATWGAGLNGCAPERMADCLVHAARPLPEETETP